MTGGDVAFRAVELVLPARTLYRNALAWLSVSMKPHAAPISARLGVADPGAWCMTSLRYQAVRWIESSRSRLQGSPWARWIPARFLTHYVIPLIVPGDQAPYDSQASWDQRYAKSPEFSDGITVSQSYNPLFTRYHYNSTENSIIRHFCRVPAPTRPVVLDVGSGAGHWIDFYREVFAAQRVVGVDTAYPCVEALRSKYEQTPDVSIQHGDISAADLDPDFGETFDIINAVGVLFHIVRDELWRQVLRNFACWLRRGGTVVVGGHFGWITQNVQFCRDQDSVRLLVSKRVRSLRYWCAAARKCGLRVVDLQHTRSSRGIRTPQNNVLFLVRDD